MKWRHEHGRGLDWIGEMRDKHEAETRKLNDVCEAQREEIERLRTIVKAQNDSFLSADIDHADIVICDLEEMLEEGLSVCNMYRGSLWKLKEVADEQIAALESAGGCDESICDR